jgi:sec-independent protein translocase protein TatA
MQVVESYQNLRSYMGRIGMPELILIAVVVLLLFGAAKLPEIGASIGKAIREFKRTVKDVEDEAKK